MVWWESEVSFSDTSNHQEVTLVLRILEEEGPRNSEAKIELVWFSVLFVLLSGLPDFLFLHGIKALW